MRGSCRLLLPALLALSKQSLDVLGHCHHAAIALPSSDQVLVLPIGTFPLDVVGAASSSSRGRGGRAAARDPWAPPGRPGGGRCRGDREASDSGSIYLLMLMLMLMLM
jgi:hypothetical protein